MFSLTHTLLFACSPTKYGIYDKMLALPWKMAKHLYSIVVYTIHTHTCTYFLFSLPVRVRVCAIFSRMILLFHVCRMPHMSRSSKLKSWLRWLLFCFIHHHLPPSLCWCSLLIENYDENTKEAKKKRFKNYTTLRIKCVNRSHYRSTITIAHSSEHPTTYAAPANKMTNSNGHEEKLPLIRLRVCKCVHTAYVSVPTEAVGFPGKMSPVTYTYISQHFRLVGWYDHKIQSANMKCLCLSRFGRLRLVLIVCWLTVKNDYIYIYQSLTQMTLIKCRLSHPCAGQSALRSTMVAMPTITHHQNQPNFRLLCNDM